MFGLSLGKIILAIRGDLAYAGGCTDFFTVCSEPQQVEEGSLFFLLEEETEKKEAILHEVWQRKAGGVVAALRPEELPTTVPPGALIVVADPLRALQQLAVAQRNLFQEPVIVLAGGAEKKELKEILRTLLETRGAVLCYEESSYPEVALPLQILALRREHRAFLVEFGEQELGSSDFLFRLCQPDYGVITQFSCAAQADLFAHLPRKGGLVLNKADRKAFRPWLSNLRCSLAWFGSTADAAGQVFSRQLGFKPEEFAVALGGLFRH